MGVPARGGGKWTKTQIQHITTFEGYATGEYTTDLEGQTYTMPCPMIIPMHIWERAQETRTHNKVHRSRNVKEDYLCSGLVTCPCGVKWFAKTNRGMDKKRPDTIGIYGYYMCNKYTYDSASRDPRCPGTIGSKRVDREVWEFIRNLCRNPEVIREAIDTKIGLLQVEQADSAVEAERLQRELDKIQEERNRVITWARMGSITEEDMSFQLAGLHIQTLELRKKYNEAAAASAAQSQAEALIAWAETYLGDVSRGVEVLSQVAAELGETDRARLYQGLEARRFEARFEGDTLKALDWAMFEERRRVVRTLTHRVLIVKGQGKQKEVIPELVLEIPENFVSLVSGHQSLDYRPWEGDTINLAVDAAADGTGDS